MKRGGKLEQVILKSFTNIECTLIYVDLGDIPSVVSCSETILKKFVIENSLFFNLDLPS